MKIFTRVCIPVFLMALFVATVIEAQTNRWEERFFKASQSYKDDRFKDAAKEFSDLIQSDGESGHLYYNLGNAFFRQGQIGHAILNYERAHVLIPRDPDLNFNLRYARNQVTDNTLQPVGFISKTFFWLKSLNLRELFRGFAIFNMLLFSVFIVRLFFSTEWTYYLSIALLILWLTSGLSFSLKWYQLHTDNRAVILSEETNVLAGPDIRDTTLFKLHAGTIVYHERSESGWCLIRLPDEKRGWIKAPKVECIAGRS